MPRPGTSRQRWTMILDEILARVYLMRCQLVHGAATYGGKLNRTSLKRCVMMMQRLLPALLAGVDRPRCRRGLGADVLSADGQVAGITAERVDQADKTKVNRLEG